MMVVVFLLLMMVLMIVTMVVLMMIYKLDNLRCTEQGNMTHDMVNNRQFVYVQAQVSNKWCVSVVILDLIIPAIVR